MLTRKKRREMEVNEEEANESNKINQEGKKDTYLYFDPIVRSESGSEYPLRNPNFSRPDSKLTPAEEDAYKKMIASNFQTAEEYQKARYNAAWEIDPKTNRWSIEHVDENGNASLCNMVTGVCIAVALTAATAASIGSAFSGGKTRSRKRKGKKTRRRHKK